MPSLVVIGAQWGDEGKGKLVDCLTSKADLVLRFQGGNNAGHTVVVDGEKTKLHLVPSGILRPQARCGIAAAVVINPEVLIAELEQLKKAGVGISPERLVIDQSAHFILPYHTETDLAREEARGEGKIGTTGRGIGPAYEDRATRCGVRVAELFELEELKERLKSVIDQKNAYLQKVLGSSREVSFEEVAACLEQAREYLQPFVGNVSLETSQAIKAGKRVVFEGAQGTMLDQIHGTVPYVTSSNTLAGAVMTSCGIGPKCVDYILAVSKAYCTRVGGGPFPTELHDELGNRIREQGSEYGTTTGRPRRCGWFDAVAVRKAVRLSGIDALAITKLDVLSGLEKVKVCTGYQLDGNQVDDFPVLLSELERVEPQYLELEGWDGDFSAVKRWEELPAAMQRYLESLAEIVECPIAIAGIGADRDATLIAENEKFLRKFL